MITFAVLSQQWREGLCLVLGGADDDFRIVVTLSPEGDEPMATLIYPCRLCGWREDCEEGCHT